MKRNFMATLLLSQGVAMIRSGDELGQSQHGNNNAYCQDNELTWLDWGLTSAKKRFSSSFVGWCKFGITTPCFSEDGSFKGRSIRGSGITDISWFSPVGRDMNDEDWGNGFVRCLGVRLAGDLVGDVDEHGERIVGDTMLLLLNASHETIPFCLPPTHVEQRWECIVDTGRTGSTGQRLAGGDKFQLLDRSMAVFRTQVADQDSSEMVPMKFARAMLRRRRSDLG